VLKNFWLFAACSWTVFIAIMCLISFNDLPKVSVGNIDKFVHAGFYFLLTIFWYIYLRIGGRTVSSAQILFMIVAVAGIYGIAIEFAQAAFTKTRQADMFDAVANFSGSVTAAILISVYVRFVKRQVNR